LLPNLNSTDWLIVLLYLFSVLAIGFSLRTNIKTSKDFLQAGRALPSWICALAFIAASLGSQEIVAMGAAGARYGFRAALFFSLGAIPALLFAGVYMMPLYYGSGARTVPEYLGLRFDRKTRLLNACTFAVTTLASAGISLYLMARLFQALEIFDPLFYAYGWPHQGIFTFCVLLSAAVVLVYVLLAGLAGVLVNQVLQFLLIVAGFLPVVVMGLKNIGGWGGLKAALPAAFPHTVYVLGTAPAILAWLLLGFVLGGGRWSTDFRILQAAMAAKNIESARRIPLFAAAVMLFIPFLLILPGAIAIGLPTPQSTTVVREENGVIFHEITVVPPEVAQGLGLVPARLDPSTNRPQLDSSGNVRLNYDRAAPAMLMHFLPTGLLGLGLSALLASLMSGLASSFTALDAVFTCDIYQSFIRKGAGDRHLLAVGRWAALGWTLLTVGAAYAISGFDGFGFKSVLDALLLVSALAITPQLATILIGMFSRRATGHSAFAGLAAGTAAAVLHYGLTLPAGAEPSLYGGWIAVAHRYPGFIAECFWTAVLGFAVNAAVALAVSLSTKARPEKELGGLVHSLTKQAAVHARSGRKR
jgi:solute:Na+ symporter, SSS family